MRSGSGFDIDTPRFVGLAAVAPLPAILVGSIVAHRQGVAWEAFAPNVVGVVVGIAMTAAISDRAARWAMRWMPPAALVLIAATLAAESLDGVHRWLWIPGIRLNASMALAPWALLALAVAETKGSLGAIALVAGVQVAHIAQPDGGQAMALAAGSVAVLLSRAMNAPNAGASLLVSALFAVAWMRPDPLAPVDHVERILHMIGQSMVWVVIASAAGLCLAAPLLFVARARDPATKRLALGFIVMLVTAFAATWLGNFPVPVFGAGASGVLGWYSMVAALVVCSRR